MHKSIAGALAALLLVPMLAPAQSTSAPTTAHVRREVIMPPGYQRFTVAGRDVIANSRDAVWLRDAIPKLPPTTMPSAMPSDLAVHLTNERATYITRMTKDLALPDDKLATETIDTLIGRLQKLNNLKAPVILFVTTEPDLHGLIKNGWSDPRFYYNRAADRVEMRGALSLSIDEPMDDQLLPITVNADDADALREKRFLDGMPALDLSLAQQVSNQGKILFYGAFAAAAADKVFSPMKLPRDQEWLAQGVTNYLPFRYLADLGGGDFDQLFFNFSHVPKDYPLQPSAIDLTNPLKEDSMRPDLVGAYDSVLRAKASLIVAAWAKEAGQDSISKVMAAVRANPPKTSDDLLKLIKDKTYVDLGRVLKE